MKQFFRKVCRIFTRSMDNELSYKEVLDLISKSQNVKLIDVRSIQEYDEGHLDGAICIPLYELQNDIVNKIKDIDTVIILYCASGVRSLKGKKILDDLGYKNVYNLEGGIENLG
ncbi:MAG: rhodanese-like domain-containing protein [Clostridia bacterium]|nr:rhodanese-like domain-containing protein [Clostridia bacterium]